MVLGDGWLGSAIMAAADSQATGIDLLTIGSDPHASDYAPRLRALLRPGPDLTVVNAVGLVAGTDDELTVANVDVPTALVECLSDSGAYLVHLGSAAEYGPPDGSEPLAETRDLRPVGAYGTSKARGSAAVLSYRDSCVLRPFNIVDRRMPPTNPVAEIRARLRDVLLASAPMPLLSPDTVRDFVSRDFVVRSVLAAARLRATGVFNVCSGSGIRFGDMVKAMAAVWGRRVEVDDLAQGGIPLVIGDPTRWRQRSGISGALNAAGLAQIVCHGDDLDPAGGTLWM